ncbi:phospholipase C type enzyme [Xanthoria parietina]
MKPAEAGVGAPSTINILSYNCWGLKYLAKYRVERLQEIGRSIAAAVTTPEIVGLQECWTQEDYLAIRRQTRHILPHGKFYHSGIFGGGLAILSKWPILESNMVRYPLNGRPTAFFRGDWYVGKGVACASIQTAQGKESIVEVFCTHLHAPYAPESEDSYMCHRTAQAWEIARLMRQAAERGHAVIGLGDFNLTPSSLAYQLITTHAPVQDVWRALHPDSSIASATHPLEKARRRGMPNARYNLRENGTTCDSVLNTWRWSKQQQKQLFKGKSIIVDQTQPDPRAKRLDYIFFSSGLSVSPRPAPWRIDSARVGMTERHPTLDCSLSDHFSVEATVSRAPPGSTTNAAVKPKQSPLPEQTSDTALRTLTNTSLHPTLYTSYNPSPTSSLLPGSFTRTPSPPDAPSDQGSATSQRYLPPSVYDEILALITSDRMRAHRQRRLRLFHFVASIIISMICFIAIWWSSHAGISFMLVFISTLNLGGGIVQGLIGGLFEGSEMRALKEFQWEMERCKESAETVDEKEGAVTEGVMKPTSVDNEGHAEGRILRRHSLEEAKMSGEEEKELWEKVRASEEYSGKENRRRGQGRFVEFHGNA